MGAPAMAKRRGSDSKVAESLQQDRRVSSMLAFASLFAAA
jgi:hypothetical protein